MVVDKNVRFEALSALLGTKITALDDVTALHGVTDLHGGLALQGVNPRIDVPTLSVDGFVNKVISCKYNSNDEEFFINEKEFFDPDYDRDFTNLSDSAACKRGDDTYERPNGWQRMALKVKGKYPDGDTWLGTDGLRSNSVSGEWPVSYHGTGLEGARGIVRSHYTAGGGQVYGRGIYSTPKLSEAEKYCKTFTSRFTGKTYKVIMQNRINPEEKKPHGPGYWLIPVPEGTSAEEEKRIVESSIRPYGVLIKEI